MLHGLELKVLHFIQRCSFKQLKHIHAVIITASLNQVPEIRLKFLRKSTEYGTMEYANLIFDQMGGFSSNEVPIWNAMVRGYSYNGPFHNCLSLFDEMTQRGLEPNNFTYPYVLSTCSKMGMFSVGKKVHARAMKSGFVRSLAVGNALFDFYVKETEPSEIGSMKNGELYEARMIFDDICERSVELWNKMIGKYASIGDVKNGRLLFDAMPQRDVVTWNTMLCAYAKAKDVASAANLFERMPEKNVVTWTTMLGAYAGASVEMARLLFDKMPEKNVVSWNCMMSIYNQKCEFQRALDLFVQMQSEGVPPDSFTFVAALSACSNLNDLESGRWVHSLLRDWHNMAIMVGTCLVEMYANCGEIHKAFSIFLKIGNKDVFCYNIVIKALAVHGRSEDAIKVFHLMQRRGLQPNDHTYSSALFACSHGGLVDQGYEIFKAMARHSSTTPKLEHYCSMVDLLCRNDQIEEAENLIKAMPIESDIAIWGAFLSGCRDRHDVKLAEVIINKAIELNSDEPGVHVLLSNIHASMGQWKDALRAREIMEEKGILKITGSSSII